MLWVGFVLVMFLACSKKIKAHIEKTFKSSICVLGSDEGGEYFLKNFQHYYRKHDIH
jgi:hypothetical protein